MFRQEKWGFDWTEFITGIMFVIAAYFVLVQPAIALKSGVIIFAIIAIIKGIATVSGFTKFRKLTGNLSFIPLIVGVLDIVIGCYFLFNLNVGVVSLVYVFAIWFIMDSISGIAISGHLKQAGVPYMVLSIIFDILGLLAGVMMLMAPVVAAVTLSTLLAFYLGIFGFGCIFVAFARRH